MTSEDHNKYVAYTFLGHAAFQLFWALCMGLGFLLMFSSLPPQPGNPGAPPTEFFAFIFGLVIVFQVLFTTPAVIAAWAMLKRKPWAKIASIIAAVMAAMSVPIGTATCIYAMWFWFGEASKEVYESGGRREGSVQGLRPADSFEPADEFRPAEEWMRQPPDWR